MLLWCGSSPDWDLVLCPPTALCRATNNDRYDVHNISMHSQMYGQRRSLRTLGSPHLVLLLEPRLYLNTKESPTRYDWSRSPSLWIRFFSSSIFIQTRFNRFTHGGEKCGTVNDQKSPRRLQNTVCSGAEMATYEINHCQWLQWLLIYTLCQIN